ncbi:galactosyltransferase-related protein [Shinella sp. M27]|uniref:galactosyltransferase-related protein n=1 Tax=Shinella sp. M27 TaxID=3368614 RepID=UPI003BA007A6
MQKDTAGLVINSTITQPVLTVIITIRAAAHYDMVGRLRNRLLDTRIPSAVSFLVVDEGSQREDALRMMAICEELGFDYLRVDSDKANFCAATARNIGVSCARSTFVMHEDVDLFPYPGFYQDLLDEIVLQNLHDHSDRFITVPALYLSEQATENALTGNLSKNAIVHDFLTGGNLVTTFLPASSVIIVNRMYYLAIGGYNDQFNGWGLEDLEYAYRLVRANQQFVSPKDHTWLIESGYSSHSAYRGWRAQFRLHAELLSRKGIFIFHAHHLKDPAWRNKEQHQENKALFRACIERFDAEGHFLPALAAQDKGKSLIFGKGTFAYNPSLMPLWGELEVKGYEAFADIDIVDYIRTNNINRVIFTNPYASERRRETYARIRDAGIPYLVVERGALTDSMFIDDTGFCCESTRYRREHWPATLDENRLQRVKDYIASETSSSSTLEKQGTRLGVRAALQKLGLPRDKKVLFVPFQSRADTTVNFFAGGIGSFDNFVSLVRDVTRALPADWVVLFKNHPLSSVQEEIPGAIDVGDMHIKDLLDITDYILLMNSGVGVLSILFGKPAIHTAQAFYSDPGLNREAYTVETVLSLLREGFTVDQDSRQRFLSYLIEDFYSFGTFTVSERMNTDKARLTITDRIDYYRVNFLGERILDVGDATMLTNVKAPVYDLYRESLVSQKLAPPKKPAAPAKAWNPQKPPAIVAAGRAAFEQQRFAEAAALFDQVSSLLPKKPNHYRQAAEAFYKHGETQKAIARLEKARELAPENKAIRRRIKEMGRSPLLQRLLPGTPFPVVAK